MTDTLSIAGGEVPDPGERPGGTLPISSAESTAISAAPAMANAGDRIGAYILVKPLAAGSFGQVWLAERHQPYFQRVALKLLSLKGDMAVRGGLFEQERQALASLEHPGIAKLLDGGTTDAGQPYYVMEFVDGKPLAEFCDGLQLDLRARMELFLQVCDAVAHAHGRFILHRDLKPGNILAYREERRDADGNVRAQLHAKVIDFGLAKSLQKDGFGQRTYELKQGAPVGSPLYMSPEQWEGGEVDPRTDVYSLGVVLYELLCGVLPMDDAEFGALEPAQRVRAMREHVPMRPSARLSHLRMKRVEGAMEHALEGLAGSRALDLHRLVRTLAHELDWIPERAMQRDREARYRDVAQLADDVRNWLDGRPLLAAPDTAVYRVRKFVGRNPWLVAASAAAVGFLVTGVVVSTAFGVAERRARELSEARERQVREVASFQQRMLERVAADEAGRGLFQDIVRRAAVDGQADDFGQRLGRVNATDVATDFIERTILRPAAEALKESGYATQPEVQAQLQESLAAISLGLDRGELALELSNAALAIRMDVLAQDPEAMVRALTQRARALRTLLRLEEAVATAREALQRSREAFGAESEQATELEQVLAGALMAQGAVQEAVPLVRHAAEARAREFGGEDLSVIEARASLATMLIGIGSEAARNEAEQLLRADLAQSAAPPKLRVHLLANLADLLLQRALVDGMPAERQAQLRGEAAEHLAQAVAGTDTVYGESHSESLLMQARAANSLAAAGLVAEARRLRERSVRLLDASPNVTDETATTLFTNLGLDLAQDPDRVQEAAQSIERALARSRRGGVGSTVEVDTLLALGRVRLLQGQADAGLQLMREAIALRRTLGAVETDKSLLLDTYDLAGVLLELGRIDEAIEELERVAPGAVERHRTQVSQASRLVIGRLREAYEARNAERPGSISADKLKQSEAWLQQMLAMGDG